MHAAVPLNETNYYKGNVGLAHYHQQPESRLRGNVNCINNKVAIYVA